MNQTSAKQVRKAARKLAGDAGVKAIHELQHNMQTMANSLSLAHKRIDDLTARVDGKV